MIAACLPRLYAAIQDPTAGILEYSPLPGEMAVFDRLLPQVDAAADALQVMWRELSCELLLLRWPEARSRSTTLRRLTNAGLAARPDDDDFFD